MAKSKTKISKQLKKKKNSELVESILKTKKEAKWAKVASKLSTPTKKRVIFNLEEINSKGQEKDKILIPGKVLSQGEMDKKMKIIALNFSDKAKEKLLNSGCEASTILEEIKSNRSAEGIKILEK